MTDMERAIKWGRLFAEADGEGEWESCRDSIYGPQVVTFIYQDSIKAALELADAEIAAALASNVST